MNKRLTYIGACLALLLAGCNNDESAPAGPEETNGITLLFSVSNEARNGDGSTTGITFPDGLVGTQHAETVYLYIFQGEGEEAEYITVEDIGWKAYFEANGGLPDHTAQMPYRLQYKDFQHGTPYTFLAVGLSQGAEDVYGFPNAISIGTTLGEAQAALASGKTCNDIRTSEIYVGTEPFTTTGSDTQTTIELRRRVAGGMAFFKNVPSAINGTPVANVRLSLYKQQNTAMPLVERSQSPVFLDYIDSPTQEADGQVLFTISTAAGTGSDETPLQGGAYVLPIPAPEDENNYTLRIELTDTNGTVLDTRRAKLPEDDELDQGDTGGGTGIIDTESAFRFPIVANHFYAIGSPKSPIDLEGSGMDIIITIDPTWAGEEDLEITEQS